MSIKAMQYALEVLENFVEDPRCETHRIAAVHFLKQAIAEAEKQEPDDDIYDIWVEQGTCQENRQVAKNATTWVGLTDEERGMVVNANFGIGVWEMARAIEAKLREKNNG